MRVSRMRLGQRRVSRERMQEIHEHRLRLRAESKKRQIESAGRPVGKVAGSWVTDLAELKQSIMLCELCDVKFRSAAARYGYELKRRWQRVWGGVGGQCDGCREVGLRRRFYAHGSLIGKI